jgi:hypothetical protein
MRKKVVAKHKKKGTKYIYAEIIKHAPNLCEVMTEASCPKTWLVDTFNVEFLKKKKFDELKEIIK